ncbi:hypothetical protein HCB37_14525 [Listeria booriae]|nr:hypothetical protein [Listeria booriae]MBC1553116.1 hypothetical protein [Listeria booriae]MBC1558467.1 hypothetical protein [Listeria booriae]MBC1920364.1 hypothetical protein [Listeria booriae]MBC2025193.1 hypothetical protein [Listeria booriae]MBC2048877.1 hypothetical protein [Listeria booriae]
MYFDADGRLAWVAGFYFVPGIGQVAMVATAVGAGIYVGWKYKKQIRRGASRAWKKVKGWGRSIRKFAKGKKGNERMTDSRWVGKSEEECRALLNSGKLSSVEQRKLRAHMKANGWINKTKNRSKKKSKNKK